MTTSIGSWLLAAAAPIYLLHAGGNAGAATIEPATLPPAQGQPGNDARKLAGTVDGGWINLSGRVISSAPNTFVLDHGGGKVTVEMDDWDWYKEGAALKPGDQVVVRGRVDNDFVTKKQIEASSVYVRNLNTYFYANPADEEAVPLVALHTTPPPGQVDATGIVHSVEGREFTLGSASGPLRIDTSAMPENPLDAEGFLQVKKGDHVYIWGKWNTEMAESPEIRAGGIVRFMKDPAKSNGG